VTSWIRALISADRQDEEDHMLASVRRGDKVDHSETIRLHKDGRALPISLTVSPIRDEAGRVIGVSKMLAISASANGPRASANGCCRWPSRMQPSPTG
jgi:PAS domain S-box-containing protein